jgi:arylsulfatase A-like enzyme
MKRPDILVLYTDQQRFDALGAAGNPHIRTPVLDKLSADGVRMDRFFVQNPVCMPSRMSMLTGLYPSTLGIEQNGCPLGADVPTLPALLSPYGYFSANVGKLHFLPHSNRDHRIPHPRYGFDHLEISDEPGPYEDAYRAFVRAKAPDQLDRIDCGLPPAAVEPHKTYVPDDIAHRPRDEHRPRAFEADSSLTHTAFVAEQTIEFLRRHRDETFMCIAGFFSPHSPWVAPKEFLDLYDPARMPLPPAGRRGRNQTPDDELREIVRAYYAMVSEVDHHVGRILACLDELGLSDDTIVLFVSDHGEWLGELGRFGKGRPAHDCISRVPCILRYPRAGVSGGRVVNEFVEAVDVLPTLLSLAGVPVPPHLQGRPMPLTANAGVCRPSALTEGEGFRTIRTEGFRYLLQGDGTERLWDLRRPDAPYEDVSPDPAFAQVLSEHRKELARRLTEMARHKPRTAAY